MNINKIHLIFLFSFLCFAQNSNALDCKEGGETTAEMKECADKGLEEATKKLNATYGSYRKLLEPKQQKDLKAVQLAWIKYKDLRCDLEYSFFEGGSIAGVAKTSCLASVTKQRLEEFEDALKERTSR